MNARIARIADEAAARWANRQGGTVADTVYDAIMQAVAPMLAALHRFEDGHTSFPACVEDALDAWEEDVEASTAEEIERGNS